MAKKQPVTNPNVMRINLTEPDETVLSVEQPQSVNLSYDAEEHRLKLDQVTLVNLSEQSLSSANCRIVVGRGADQIQTLRDDLHFSIEPGERYCIPSDKLVADFPLDLERDITLNDGKDYYLAFILGEPEIMFAKFSLERVIRTGTNSVGIKKGEGVSGEAMTIDEVVDALKVQFPHAVRCEIDLQSRTAEIGRIELKNTSKKTIPAGWRAKVGLLQGIDRRMTLVDTIVLPIILSKLVIPLGPFSAKMPRDVINSEDEWNLELYIVDPFGNEELLFRSASVSFAYV